MIVQYLGHSGFYLEHDGTKLIIDLFLTGNPLADVPASDVDADYVLLSHAHGDHAADGINIAERCGATVISTFEIATWCLNHGIKAHGMHIGGAHEFPFGRVKLTIAHHGSSMTTPDGNVINLGNPCGFVFNFGNKTFYHTGDTGLFLDMKLIGEINNIDVAFVPIGDNFTMGIDDAVKAVEFIRPKTVIPMHYNTFDVIKTDPDIFVQKVKPLGVNVLVPAVGESFEI